MEAIFVMNSDLFMSTLLLAHHLAVEVGKVGTYKSWFEVCLLGGYGWLTCDNDEYVYRNILVRAAPV